MSHVFNIRHRENTAGIRKFLVIFIGGVIKLRRGKGAKPTFNFGGHAALFSSIRAAEIPGGTGFSLSVLFLKETGFLVFDPDHLQIGPIGSHESY